MSSPSSRHAPVDRALRQPVEHGPGGGAARRPSAWGRARPPAGRRRCAAGRRRARWRRRSRRPSARPPVGASSVHSMRTVVDLPGAVRAEEPVDLAAWRCRGRRRRPRSCRRTCARAPRPGRPRRRAGRLQGRDEVGRHVGHDLGRQLDRQANACSKNVAAARPPRQGSMTSCEEDGARRPDSSGPTATASHPRPGQAGGAPSHQRTAPSDTGGGTVWPPSNSSKRTS